MLTPNDAQEQIARRLPGLPAHTLPLGQCAGAILREQVLAERDHPPFDRVTMDGIAVLAAAVAMGRPMRVQAVQAAGDPPLALADTDDCIEVMTGAVLPAGCDAVVPVEQLRRDGDTVTLVHGGLPEPRQFIHARGSDRRQGAVLLTPGMRLGAAHVGIAAGAGCASLQVTREPAIAILSTGSELVEPGAPIEAWQLRRSNAHAVAAALRLHGFTRVTGEHLADTQQVLEARIAHHLADSNVLILSGGVSMGRLDLVPAALAACGVDQVFHRVAQRPGKPLWFGTGPHGIPVFALPGNPVSTLACLLRYVLPALRQAMGASPAWQGEPVALAAPVPANAALTQFLPAAIMHDDHGHAEATPMPFNGSGDYAALVDTVGFIEIPPGTGLHPKGTPCRLYRW